MPVNKNTAADMLRGTVKLSNNLTIPQIHLGLYMMSPAATTRSVRWALQAGYRAFDSAQWYYNERETAAAIADFLSSSSSSSSSASTTSSPSPPLTRQDIHYTSKLQTNTASYAAAKKSIDSSIKAAEDSGIGHIDLYLLHSPLGGREARLASWRAVEDSVLAGKVRMAGVSNFGVRHLEELMSADTGGEAGGLRVRPVVNQIEVHPFNTQTAIREACGKYGIVVQAYAPLARGMRFRDPTVRRLGVKYGCSGAQLFVRWSIQHGFITLPKSARQDRLVENADVGWFEISNEDMETLDGLDEHLVTDWDPTDAP